MAASQTFIVNGIRLTLITGMGNEDGVSIHPDNIPADMTNEQLGALIRELGAMYQDFKLCSYVDHIVFGQLHALEDLSRSPQKYVEELRQKCSKALEQKSFPYSEQEAATIREFIAVLGDILNGRKFNRPKTSVPLQKGYVYLIRAIEPNSHYKIGLSKEPVTRIEKLDVKLPFPVEVIHLIKTDNMRGLELSLHEKYADKRVNGEWFALTDADVLEIRAMKGIE